MLRKVYKTALLSIAATLLHGCASAPHGERGPDPLERYNRAIYSFNEKVDKYVAKPIAEGYQAVTPDFVDKGITNFFGNLDDVTTMINSLLQFKGTETMTTLGRITINSSLGLFGLVDAASAFGLYRQDEDFGQTLGYWGIPPGPYLVLPFWGPSTVRDSFGLGGDYFTEPYTYLPDQPTQWGLFALEVVDTRADLLSAGRILEQSTFDPYAFLRDAYLQQRRNLVFDGSPPEPEDEEFLFDLEEEE
ncbi:MAG TPA: VacJ family lipoprotein [Gammaproteobacteria bacterium]|nr:VacJ family lipoprotein [Gammaproteobacteria bacterium]